MTSTSGAQGLKLKERQIERRSRFTSAQLVSVAIWVLLASVFLLDIVTPPDIFSICFANAIPIFMSLFERRPRPILYASIATVMTLVGSLIQPTGNISTVAVETNRLIAVLTQWLIAMLVRLQQQRVDDMQAKAEYQHRFVDILSHEIGNALTTVDGQALRLMKLSEQLAPSDLRLRAGKIRTAVDRIQAIIDRIQFASSLSDGSIPITHRSIDLLALLQEAIEQMTEDPRTGSIELILCPEPQVVSGDEMLLRQVFENIIMNSVKYSPRDTPISVNVTKRGDVIRITITDRGSGIPQHELSQVRRPYYRGENSKGTGGAGLGLYLVERIVDAHKGRLFIESEVGKGTKVVVDIPRSKDVAAA